jgi:alpha-D-xyloside xylohydrolase
MTHKRSMSRRRFAESVGAIGMLSQTRVAAQGGAAEPIHPGVWRFRFGRPEAITPVATRRVPPARDGLRALPHVRSCPVAVEGALTERGYVVRIPLAPNELIYGLGLQLQSFMQRGLKKKLRVNADPRIDSGDSHAPAPFYVTTRGYGVLIDAARYVTIYCGNKKRKGAAPASAEAQPAAASNGLPAAYARFDIGEPCETLVEIPEAQGVDVYVFGGPAMREAVQRYNLFSGGGALPPRWGLGFWYRCYGEFDQRQVENMAAQLRDSRIPCDVLGLEPGWQTHAYSCSFVWSGKFPDPESMLRRLGDAHYRVNLWEHAFTHPSSPLYKPLYPLSGDYEVWGGLVPDFLLPETRRVFADFHEREHVSKGVAGYKLDECDNSDFTRNWSFPELSRFPSGADGEQTHCLFGLRYQDTIQSIFERRNTRTLGLARSSHALAAPYPYVLYSDLYDHREFIRGVVNAGFSGLLWCPEVRDAKDGEDLLRRLQTAVFSPLAMINAWYIANPPWKQVDRRKNNAGEFAPGWEQLEAECRSIIEWRMRLLPYFYSAFAAYHETGLPPFRALVMDYASDPHTWTIDDQYMAGDRLLVAPVVAGERERDVYLPQGGWVDFWTNQRFAGGRTIRVALPLEHIPVYVKDGSVLPLAGAALHSEDPAGRRITARVYGDGHVGATLIEDDGAPDSVLRPVRLTWDDTQRRGSAEGAGRAGGYEIVLWEQV